MGYLDLQQLIDKAKILMSRLEKIDNQKNETNGINKADEFNQQSEQRSLSSSQQVKQQVQMLEPSNLIVKQEEKPITDNSLSQIILQSGSSLVIADLKHEAKAEASEKQEENDLTNENNISQKDIPASTADSKKQQVEEQKQRIEQEIEEDFNKIKEAKEMNRQSSLSKMAQSESTDQIDIKESRQNINEENINSLSLSSKAALIEEPNPRVQGSQSEQQDESKEKKSEMNNLQKQHIEGKETENIQVELNVIELLTNQPSEKNDYVENTSNEDKRNSINLEQKSQVLEMQSNQSSQQLIQDRDEQNEKASSKRLVDEKVELNNNEKDLSPQITLKVAFTEPKNSEKIEQKQSDMIKNEELPQDNIVNDKTNQNITKIVVGLSPLKSNKAEGSSIREEYSKKQGNPIIIKDQRDSKIPQYISLQARHLIAREGGELHKKYSAQQLAKQLQIRDAHQKKRELEAMISSLNRDIQIFHREEEEISSEVKARGKSPRHQISQELDQRDVESSKKGSQQGQEDLQSSLPSTRRQNQIKEKIKVQEDKQAHLEAVKFVNKLKKDRQETKIKKDDRFNELVEQLKRNATERFSENESLHERLLLERRQKVAHRLNQKHSQRDEQDKLVEASKNFLKDLHRSGPGSVAASHLKFVSAAEDEHKYGEYRLPEIDKNKLGIQAIRNMRKGDFHGAQSVAFLAKHKRSDILYLKQAAHQELKQDFENRIAKQRKLKEYSKQVQSDLYKNAHRMAEYQAHHSTLSSYLPPINKLDSKILDDDDLEDLSQNRNAEENEQEVGIQQENMASHPLGPSLRRQPNSHL